VVQRRARWISEHTVTFTAVVLVLAGMFSFIGMAAASATATAAGVPLGDYAGNDSPQGISSFGSTTGTHPTLATDYLVGSNGWGAMESTGNLSSWRGSGYRLVLGVPIIPDGTGGTLAAGASGAYNSYFVTLAQNLVSGGLGNAVLRLGWEFNGNWYNWYVGNSTDAANFAAYWRNIVTAMRSVSGQSFSFLWNPNGSGPTNYTPDQAYPGDSYVDYVGTDIYDNCWCSPQTPQNAWSAQLSQAWGLNWLAGFAAAHGKAIAFPEWSVDYRSDGHGLGDDPYFINQFATWIAQNNVAFSDIFAFDTSDQQNDITDGRFPNALAAFRADFGGASASLGSPSPSPTTTKPPTPTTTKPPTPTTTRPTTPVSSTTTTASTTTTTAPTGGAVQTVSGAPGAPESLTLSVTGSTVDLSWKNSSGSLGIDVFRDGREIAWPGWPLPAPTTYTDSNVPSGAHSYSVSAYNSSGVGPSSGTLTVTVAPTATTTTPTSPSTTTARSGRHQGHSTTGATTAGAAALTTTTSRGGGYWLASAAGGVFAYGDAPFYGSASSAHLTHPVVGMAATPDGGGYWLVASDGGVFSYGDARYYGATSSQALSHPVVGIAATPDGNGYWLVGSAGGVYVFGDAWHYGATGAVSSNHVVGMASTPDGGGYWLAGADGGVFALGDATFYGSAGAATLGGSQVTAVVGRA